MAATGHRLEQPAGPLRPWRTSALAAILALALGFLHAAAAHAQLEDKALGRPATASSIELARPGGDCDELRCAPGMATDVDHGTRWASEHSDVEWWQADLSGPRLVDQVSLVWHLARADHYVISTSLDGTTFADAAEVRLDLSPRELAALSRTGRHREATIFPVRLARYVRVTSRVRAPILVGGESRLSGISFWEAAVFGPPDDGPATPAFDLPTVAAPPPPASPPAGPRSPAMLSPIPTVRIKGTATASGAAIQLLSVHAPRAATVRVRCRGRGCPERVRTRRGTSRIREVERALRAGAVIDVAVTQAGRYGKHVRFVIRRRQSPRRIDRCTLGGSARPVACPAG